MQLQLVVEPAEARRLGHPRALGHRYADAFPHGAADAQSHGSADAYPYGNATADAASHPSAVVAGRPVLAAEIVPGILWIMSVSRVRCF
jgi:hypothetical protein